MSQINTESVEYEEELTQISMELLNKKRSSCRSKNIFTSLGQFVCTKHKDNQPIANVAHYFLGNFYFLIVTGGGQILIS